jgi:glycosyltransferase involved in cell wall biosynthesis
MPSIFRSIDVIVKLSRVEGMFGPPLEAFHCGATCIATRVSGWDEYLVDGSNSLLVDVDDFASAQMSLEMLSEDQELLEKLKLGAKETALKWDDSYQSESQFSQICSDVLESEGEVHLNWARMDQMISAAKALMEAGEDPRLVFPTAICP